MYYVYLLHCSDGSLYCGWTTNLSKRLHNHNHGIAGAKYTRSRRPVELVYSEAFVTKREAMQRESVIKQFSKQKKRSLIQSRSFS